MYEVGKPPGKTAEPLTRRQGGAILIVIGLVLAAITAAVATPIAQRAFARYDAVQVEVVRQGPDLVESSRRSISRQRTVVVTSDDPRLSGETQRLVSPDAQPGQRRTAWYAPGSGELTEHNPAGGRPIEWILVGAFALPALAALVGGLALRRRRRQR